MKGLASITGAVAIACAGSVVEASLVDYGNGLIYDDVLNITWLQDARLAASNSFGVSDIRYDSLGNYGVMTWDVASQWIAAMNAANYLGFDRWRMPTVRPVNGDEFEYTVSYDGSTDRGFNNYTTSNELSHLFYATLGNFGLCSTNNATGSPADDCETSPYGTWGLKNTGPFTNFIGAGRIWTNVSHTDPEEDRAFDFYPEHGQTGTGGKSGPKYVWAVLDGNAAEATVVPVPAAAWLFGSGILTLFSLGRREGFRFGKGA